MRLFGYRITTLFVPIIILIAVFIINPNSKASSLKSANIQTNKLVKIETRDGVTQSFILIKPVDPIASVILFEGGKGKLKLSSVSGKPTVEKKPQTLLMRNREDFAKYGLMVAVIDAPSDMKKQKRGMVTFSNKTKLVFRMSNEHAEDIKTIVSYLKNQADIPVWFVSISAGTVSAINVAIRLQGEVDGLVLNSSLTRFNKKMPMFNSHPNGLLNMNLDKITIPTLIVSHKDDNCDLSPASDAIHLKEALANSPKIEVMYFTGGKKPKTKPCGALSAHGFYGIENQVVSAIGSFIKSNSK
jgi:hypothetical protein